MTMRIPSYDDLTPSIPDVGSGDVLAVEQLLPPSGPIAQSGREARFAAAAQLFACLYSPQMPDAAMAVAKEFSPRYQRYGADSVVVDVSGLGRLLGEAPVIGAELTRAAALAVPGPSGYSAVTGPALFRASPRRFGSHYGIRIEPHPGEHAVIAGGASSPGTRRETRQVHRLPPIRVAVAPTQMAALLLARAEAALVVATTDAGAALGEVPIDALRQLMAAIHGMTLYRTKKVAVATGDVEGVDWPSWRACEQAFDTLARWGVRTLGEFTALPAADLSARTGQAGVRLQQIARGIDPRPLVPEPDAPRFVERIELEWPIDGLEPLSFVLARLLDPLVAALERSDRGAAALRLDLRLVDRTTHQRVLQLPAAMRDARVFRTLLLLDLESHPPAAAIDVVTIEIDPVPARVAQYSLLEPATASAETLATLTARLGALVGDTRCGSPLLVDTHQPDAFEMRPFAPDDRHIARRDGGREPAALDPAARRRARQRSPMPVEPAGNSRDPSDGVCLRRFRPPVAIRVSVEHGRPVHVAIDRRGMPGGRVEQSAGPWRTSGAWWCAPHESWNRDEWDVTFSDGATSRLFRERDTGKWFMEAVID